MPESSPEIGVFYHPDDYIRVGKRLLIDLIDVTIAVAACAGWTAILLFVSPNRVAIGIMWLSVWLAYFVFLKRSRFRTFGYRIGRARIVNLQGKRPSVAALLIRLLFVVGGPVNFVIDLFWIPSDPCRQAIRDKFAHTYVIRDTALPAGTGRILYRTYIMLGTTFFFPEVEPKPS